jgi:hypothetical protein
VNIQKVNVLVKILSKKQNQSSHGEERREGERGEREKRERDLVSLPYL